MESCNEAFPQVVVKGTEPTFKLKLEMSLYSMRAVCFTSEVIKANLRKALVTMEMTDENTL